MCVYSHKYINTAFSVHLVLLMYVSDFGLLSSVNQCYANPLRRLFRLSQNSLVACDSLVRGGAL